jgi:hypothetical protein
LEVFVQSFDAKNSVTSRRLPLESKWTSKEESWDWKRMKKLIHLLQPPNLYVDYYLLNDPITLKKCEKLMKTTKGWSFLLHYLDNRNILFRPPLAELQDRNWTRAYS